MKKPILATGLSGLVGSRLEEIYSPNYSFHNMDLSTGVDILDYSKIRDFANKIDADTIIHFAAFTDVNRAHLQNGDKDGLCYKINVDGTQNIVNLSKSNDLYMIHISTDFVFSGSKNEYYTEEDPKDPIEWYGKTKAIAEEIVEKELDNYSIVRISYPFRSSYPHKPDILSKTLNSLIDNSLPPQFTDTIFTPTFIDEIAHALDLIITLKPTGVYHAVGSTSLSPYEFSYQVAETFGIDPSIIKKSSLDEFLKTTNRPYQRYLRTSNEKIKKLGAEFSDLESALRLVKSQIQKSQ